MGCEASHTPPSEVSLYVSDTTGMTADMSISQSDLTMNEQMDQSLDQEIDQIPMDPHAVASSEIPPQIFRLTQAQYKRIIQTVFGASINLRFNLEPDLHVEGFASLGAGVGSISARGIEQYEEAAYFIAEQAITEEFRSSFIRCPNDEIESEACLNTTLAQLGLSLWRRPLKMDEMQTLLRIGQEVAQSSNFYTGLKYTIAFMLQSPYFLFRIEQGQTDTDSTVRQLDAWEIASKISFLLWNSIPDQELFAAADSGELLQPEGYLNQIERMLADEQAKFGIRNFFYEYLRLDLLKNMRKDPNVFTHAQPELAAVATEETLALAEKVVLVDDRDMRTFFTSRQAYLNPLLASIYDVPAPSSQGFAWAELSADDPRRGFFGQVSFLALYSHPVSTSATLRGKFVRQKLLCGVIPPPPADVDTSVPEPSPDLPTLRDRIQVHLQDPTCAGCHQLTDPIGLGFEQFDGIGRFRLNENGVRIDVTGELDQDPFTTVGELSDLIITDSKWSPCLLKNVYHYVLGRSELENAQAYLDALTYWWPTQEYRLQALLIKLMTHPRFTQLHVRDDMNVQE